jgi:hypothetical protein
VDMLLTMRMDRPFAVWIAEAKNRSGARL